MSSENDGTYCSTRSSSSSSNQRQFTRAQWSAVLHSPFTHKFNAKTALADYPPAHFTHGTRVLPCCTLFCLNLSAGPRARVRDMRSIRTVAPCIVGGAGVALT